MMFAPAFAVAGPLFATLRSVEPTTVVVAVELLLFVLGSAVCDATVAVLLSTVPPGTLGPIATVTVNCWEAPPATNGVVQSIGPFDATGGWLHDAVGPVFWTSETNVVPAGSAS